MLRKVSRVHFGLIHKIEAEHSRSRQLLAVPFVGKDTPSSSSEYAHPDVAIGLTMLAYRYEGMRRRDFGAAFVHLRSKMDAEFGHEIRRPSSALWIEWVQAAGRRVRGTKRRTQAEIPSLETIADSEPAAPLEDMLPLHLIATDDVEYMEGLFGLLRRSVAILQFYLDEIVFPEQLSHQSMKLSANGQDVGGAMLFARCIGFSGTPSTLLPLEMGDCIYQMGDDGKMLRTVTNPAVVSRHMLPADWTVEALLKAVAEVRPPAHALIDCGALCTGLTNLEVAERLLGLMDHVDGVVFIQEGGVKRVLLRDGGGLVDLDRCDLPKERRFTVRPRDPNPRHSRPVTCADLSKLCISPICHIICPEACQQMAADALLYVFITKWVPHC